MAKPHLLRRNNRYFLRLHIPLDVRRWFDGKAEIRRSLKTMQYNTAKTRLRTHLYRIERVFTMMRCGMLTDEQIRTLVANYFRDSLQDTERDRAINVKPLDPEDHAYRQEGLDLHLTTMKEDFTHGQYERYVSESVETVIERAGIPVEKGSDEYKVLCRELMKGLIEATGIEIGRLTGNYQGELLGGVGVRVAVEGGTSTEGGSKVDEGRLLSVLIPEYLSECATGGRWSARTQKEGRSYFNLFLSLTGDRGIKSLDRRAFNDYRTLLTRWPKNVKQKSEYRGKSVGEILELSKGTKAVLSTSSVNQHIGNIQAFMKWCVRNGYADADYSEGLTISTRKERADEKREEYSREDLQRLITSPLYTGKKIARGRPERYWVPLIALFNGMRVNEICQLYTDDVYEVEGLLCFDVNDKDDKSLKNASSRRVIPVHPALLDLGFGEYVEGLKGEGKKRLWEKLERKRNGYGHDFTKWYLRFNRRYITEEPKRVFHSFRHCFANGLKQAKVEESIIKEILGHSHGAGSITLGRYGKAYHVGTMHEALRRIEYGIDLSVIPRYSK